MIVSATDVRIVLTTVSSREEAESIAEALVEQRLAACVNLVPGLRSIYRWQGEVETAEEVLLLIKTTAERLERTEAHLRRLHSYEVPEFLVLSAEAGNQSYVDWLTRSVSAPE